MPFPTVEGVSSKEGLAAFDSLKEQITALENQLKQLHALQTYLSNKGFTEAEYINLLAKLPSKIRNMPSFEEKSPAVFTVLDQHENAAKTTSRSI